MTGLARRRCLQALAAWPAAGLLPAQAADVSVERSGAVVVPDVPLVTHERRRTTLARELAVDGPLWLNFVFTTCSTTCSLQTAVLSALQARLAAGGRRARFLSLTIDPDNDTPEQLARFAQRFAIRDDWQFCTGRFDDLLRPQQAFDVYRGSKASHPPVVMLRAGRRAPWWRISGFPAAADLQRLLNELESSV